jgi:hypothetical protein
VYLPEAIDDSLALTPALCNMLMSRHGIEYLLDGEENEHLLKIALEVPDDLLVPYMALALVVARCVERGLPTGVPIIVQETSIRRHRPTFSAMSHVEPRLLRNALEHVPAPTMNMWLSHARQQGLQGELMDVMRAIRVFAAAARKIQRAWRSFAERKAAATVIKTRFKLAISSPQYVLCRSRLLREACELLAE